MGKEDGEWTIEREQRVRGREKGREKRSIRDKKRKRERNKGKGSMGEATKDATPGLLSFPPS